MKEVFEHTVSVDTMFVGTNFEEALTILSYRVKLTTGDLIELTDGTKAIVSVNHTDEMVVSCIVPIIGDKYECGCSNKTVPYNLIKAPMCGECVPVDTFTKAEGLGIVRELIEREKWQDAYETIPYLKEAGVDVSELVEVLKRKDS